MYRLTVDGDETYMIVTRNVFSHRMPVYKKYDLKVSGSCLKSLSNLQYNESEWVGVTKLCVASILIANAVTLYLKGCA